MTTTQIVFMYNKKSNDQRIPLYIRITKNRRSTYINTGIRLLESQWDDTRKRAKSGAPNSGRINSQLSSIISKINGLTLDLELKGKSYSSVQIKDMLTASNDDCFISYYETWIEDRAQRGKISYGTHKRYKSVITKLAEYVDGPLSFSQFDYDFLIKYESYLLNDLSNSQNTVNSNFNCLRKAMNDAVRSGRISIESNPFFRYQFKSVSTSRAFLTNQEIEEIKNIESLPSDLCYLARDIFLFITQTGIRIGDVLMLRNRDFDGQRMHFILGKTKSQTSVLLTSKAQTIVGKYWKEESSFSEQFLFPVVNISPKEQDPKKLTSAISSATFKINRCLKRSIIPRTSIQKEVSSHVGRHSLATNALLNGLTFEEIRSILKHKDVQVTQQYAKVIDQFADQAIRKLDKI